MISFESDYITGAHPKVLQKLIDTNLEVQSGYGSDAYCASAAEKIKKACQCPQADVQFLVGGTQTNAIVIATMLQEFEGVAPDAWSAYESPGPDPSGQDTAIPSLHRPPPDAG